MYSESLAKNKALVFNGSNQHCFIERDRILAELAVDMADYGEPDRYARILSGLLDRVSTPLYDSDTFAGRVVEGPRCEGIPSPSDLLGSVGHLSPDYARVLKLGLSGILAEMKAVAQDTQQKQFVKNAEIVTNAIRRYCLRYAAVAKAAGRERMAQALETVPYAPAYDFYSALQGIWILHMIAGCYVGARDYAFGRFDAYMFPFYEAALASGETEQELTETLAGFFIKCNEICGTATHNYACKPIPSQAAKQYVNLGGETPNAFSSVILRAATLNMMPQPEITVLLKPDADPLFTDNVFSAMAELTDKLHVYNYDLIVGGLLKKGIPADVAKNFTYSACSTFDLDYHTFRREYYIPAPGIFLDTMRKRDYASVEDLLSTFSADLCADMQRYADQQQKPWEDDASMRKCFVLDSLLLTDSAKKCRYPADSTSDYNVLNFFFPGIATLGDSIAALDRLVFREKRYTYAQFSAIVQNDYRGEEKLRREILGFTRFGNDTEVDAYAAMVGDAFIAAVDKLKLKPNYFAIPGFYSLERENTWAAYTGATPDGRLAKTPFSENQSPVYGADTHGITALLKSLAKLPFDKTQTGGLNLTFAQAVTADTLKALILTYFELGGLHVGISVLNKETLKKAMREPEKYRSLTVRLYGFSELFVSLPTWQQIAVLNRTAY